MSGIVPKLERMAWPADTVVQRNHLLVPMRLQYRQRSANRFVDSAAFIRLVGAGLRRERRPCKSVGRVVECYTSPS